MYIRFQILEKGAIPNSKHEFIIIKQKEKMPKGTKTIKKTVTERVRRHREKQTGVQKKDANEAAKLRMRNIRDKAKQALLEAKEFLVKTTAIEEFKADTSGSGPCCKYARKDERG